MCVLRQCSGGSKISTYVLASQNPQATGLPLCRFKLVCLPTLWIVVGVREGGGTEGGEDRGRGRKKKRKKRERESEEGGEGGGGGEKREG